MTSDWRSELVELDAGMPEIEKAALAGDQQAVLHIVSGFRRMRAAVISLLGSRYGDGECDSASLHSFQSECEESLRDAQREDD